MTLLDWAIKHKIPADALRDLCNSCLHVTTDPHDETPEGSVQREIRLEGARAGKYLFRNNRGAGRFALKNELGQLYEGPHVRWGLANDSKALGDAVKSADLVGFERVNITQEMVGTHIARFLSVEVKRPDWKYSGTLQEIAQVKWATLVNWEGGRALITNKTGVL